MRSAARGFRSAAATSNWCTYTDCEPDCSDRNSVIGNDIADVTSRGGRREGGTTCGLVSGNIMVSDGLVEADSFIDFKGNGWTVEDNTGTAAGDGGALEDGIQIHVVEAGWGEDNTIQANILTMDDAPGCGVYLHERDRGNIVACDNEVSGAVEGPSDVDCS